MEAPKDRKLFTSGIFHSALVSPNRWFPRPDVRPL
jgi:hypothetical protein